VYGSLASTASTARHTALPVVATFPQRLSEATTSAAVISLPLWKRTPLRSAMVYRRPSGVIVEASASMGIGANLAS